MLTPPANRFQHPILRIVPAVAWMGVIFAFSAQHQVPTPPGVTFDISSLGHFTVYLVLAVLLWWALIPAGLGAWRHVAVAFGLAVLYGVSDEWHQSFVPGRTPDVVDLLVDAVGAACGLLVVTWLARRRPGWPIWGNGTPQGR